MIVQDSLNGKDWRPFYLVGQPLTFKRKADAKAWFQSFEEANDLDWRVGFLLRCRTNGKYFRLIHKNGKQVKA